MHEGRARKSGDEETGEGIELYGSPGFGAHAWECFRGATPVAQEFNPRWDILDEPAEATGTFYFKEFEQYYQGRGFDGEWRR